MTLPDAVLVFGLHEPSVLEPASALAPAQEATGKPIIFGTLGFEEDVEPQLSSVKALGVMAVLGPERLANAAIVLDRDSRAQWIASQASLSNIRRGDTPLEGAFDEYRAKNLVASYGIRVPRRILCSTPKEARDAFGQLQRPVVVKIAATDVPHKTDVGGVVLDVSTDADLEDALSKIARIPTKQPGRVLLEEMAPKGVELIVGGVRDPSWGPVIVVGIGGVLAEAVADTSVRLAPASHADVRIMLSSLHASRLLDGFRDLPVCDRDSIADVVLSVSSLLLEHPEIEEVEINPPAGLRGQGRGLRRTRRVA